MPRVAVPPAVGGGHGTAVCQRTLVPANFFFVTAIMDIRFVNPFIAALADTLTTMVALPATPAPPFIKDDEHDGTSGVTGRIQFANDEIHGSVAVVMEKTIALDIYEGFTGERPAELGADVEDAIGELANMVAGGAKQQLSEDGIHFQISLPTVRLDGDGAGNPYPQSPTLVVPFDLERSRTLFLEVTLATG